MDSRNLSLRILYTINSSPQYILARSPFSVPVVLVPQSLTSQSLDGSIHGTGVQTYSPCYGTTSLKTCLDTICRSSPELVQDVTRDFSVYVLDPLESNSAPAPVNISNVTSNLGSTASTPAESSNGVAVGLGLMSWALVAGESDGVTVTGTVVKQGMGKESLEVIFALRETAAMQKANLAAALTSWGTLPSLTSRPSDTPMSHPPQQSSVSSKQLGSVILPGSVPSGSLQPLSNSTSSSTTPHSVSKPFVPSTSVQSSAANVLAPSSSASLRIPSRRKPPKIKKCIKAASSPSSEADKMMLAEEIYIGPRKKKGRPAKGSGTAEGGEGQSGPGPGSALADEDVIIIDGTRPREDGNAVELNQVTGSSKSGITENHPAEESTSPPPMATDPLVHVKVQTPMTILDILAYLSASSSSRDPNVQNAALLTALNAIDSTASCSGSGPDRTSNPDLVNALKDLISAVSKPASPPRARDSHIPRTHVDDHRRNISQDDEIILLEKENVNPAAFRRRAERDGIEKKVLDAELPASLAMLGRSSASFLGSQKVSTPSSAVNFDGTSHVRNLSTRLNASSAQVPAPPSSSPTGSSTRRKRTLSDFMDDRDSRINLGHGRDKQRAERRDVHRHVHSATRRTSSSSSGLRHYPRLLCDQLQRCDGTGTNSYYRTGTEFWSSPPRSRSENHSTANGGSEYTMESRLNPIDISDSPPSPRVTASSPVRSQSRPRKQYIVPTWARTETSTQPRLSEATHQALEEAKAHEGNKKKGRPRGERQKKRRVRSPTASSSASQTDAGDYLESSTTADSTLQVLPQSIASSSDCPVFAMASSESSISDLLQSAAYSRSSSPFLSKNNINVPRTPPRRRTDRVHTPGIGSGSLFTPRAVHGRPFAGSPLFSPQALFSPLSSITIKSSSLSGTSMVGDFTDQPMTPSADLYQKETDESNDALNQELDDALKEIEQPFDTSSDSNGRDIEQNEELSSTTDGTSSIDLHGEDRENRPDATINALWAGLPPSSPPPMSSPSLIPEASSDDEDMDDLELPVATSDFEECATDSEAMPPSSVPDLSICSDQEFAEYFSSNDFSALLAAVDRSPAVNHEAEFDMSVFNQFTTLNSESDGSYGDQGSDLNADNGLIPFQNGLAEFDFTEFWETFKPLVQDQILGSSDHNLDYGVHTISVQNEAAHTPNMVENVDHSKLAEDVQALLSGCLV